MEKHSRKREASAKIEPARFFSVSRPDGSKQAAASTPGITIQIRLKNPSANEPKRLLTRQNTEFWLSLND